MPLNEFVKFLKVSEIRLESILSCIFFDQMWEIFSYLQVSLLGEMDVNGDGQIDYEVWLLNTRSLGSLSSPTST